MLVILVSGTAAYGLGSFYGNEDPTEAAANNVPEGTVTQIGNQWSVRVGGVDQYFSNSPESVKDIPVETDATLQTFQNQITYLDVDNQAVLTEIAGTLSRYSIIREACYGSCDEDLPEKDCNGAENMIVWQEADENRVYQEDKCIFIEGDTKAADAFLFRILGVN